MWSARKNRIDIIKIILENNPKIDINKKNRMCKSAVDLGTIEIKNILKLHEFKMKNSDLLKELNIDWSDLERIVKVNSLWEENRKNIEILINEKINEL